MKKALLIACLFPAAAAAQSVLVPEWMKSDAAALSKEYPSLEFSFYTRRRCRRRKPSSGRRTRRS